MGFNPIESIPQRPQYYYLNKPSNSLRYPQVPRTHQLEETVIRLLDPSYKSQRLRYSGGALLHARRVASQLLVAPHLEVGNRMVNGARFSVAETSDFGIAYQDARDYPDFEDHGHGHERRVSKWISDIISNSPELGISDRRILYALSLFANHDRDQLVSEIRNVSRKKLDLPLLDPKWGHGPAGALRELATVEHLAKEGGVTMESAKEIAYLGAAMMLLHDEVELLDKALEQTEKTDGRKAYEVLSDGSHRIFRGEELMKIWTEGVDLLSLRPSQIAEITWRIKTHDKKGLPTNLVTQETPNGLDPVFEREFASSLKDIAQGQYYLMGEPGKTVKIQDQEPLPLQRLSQRLRKQFVTAARVAHFADLLEKVVPPHDAAMRKVTVDIATRRQFFQPGLKERLAKNGNLPAEEDSDIGRSEWERQQLAKCIAEHKGQLSHALSDSLYIRKLVDSIGLSTLIAEKQIADVIMSGDVALIENFVRQTYDTQLLLLAEKLVKRASLAVPNADIPIQDYIYGISKQLVASGRQDYASRLQELFAKNEELVVKTMDSLRKKPGGIREYSNQDRNEVQQTLTDIMKHQYHLSDEEVDACESGNVEQTLFHPPFNTYYSIGSAENARTMIYHEDPFRRRRLTA